MAGYHLHDRSRSESDTVLLWRARSTGVRSVCSRCLVNVPVGGSTVTQMIHDQGGEPESLMAGGLTGPVCQVGGGGAGCGEGGRGAGWGEGGGG